MRCLTDPDAATFAERVLPHLARDPVRHNVAYTVILQHRDRPAPPVPGTWWLRVVDDHDRLVGVALRTPAHPLLLTEMPGAAVDLLADQLLATDPELPSVTGPDPLADRFARRWSAATGQEPVVSMRQRLFRLDSVRPPAAVPGRAVPRGTGTGDRDRLIGWAEAFRAEVEPLAPPTMVVATIDRVLARGDALWCWEVDGEAVSMLTLSLPVESVVRVGMVYTPPQHRGRGYATASVAAASQAALDRGARACVLYTDLANPTSNKIYQAIGYRPVSDATRWQLRPPRTG